MTDILLADKYESSRHLSRLHLETQPGWRVVAEAGDGEQAILLAAKMKPDVVLIANELPLGDGLNVTRQIRARLPKTEVLVYTAHKIHLDKLIEAGALGYVLKSDPIELLLEGVRTVAAHKRYFPGMQSQLKAVELAATARRPIR